MTTLRFLTSGESHGAALVASLEGMPAGLTIDPVRFDHELARRRLGHGRSPRMNFEVDRLEFVAGLRHGVTLGSPLSVVIHNTEWPKWVEAMDPLPRDDLDRIRDTGRGERLTRPRPGHADLVGALKYGYDDVRDALERASARETAARVVIGTFCKTLLELVGIHVVSHVTNIGGVRLPDDAARPEPDDLDTVDASPVRTLDPATSTAMMNRIDQAQEDRDTLGGIIEVIAWGVPPGLGSHVHADRKIDAALAAAVVGVQAIKGVEFGLGFTVADRPGSSAHDEIGHDGHGFVRRSNRAGGIEAGMTNGQPLVMRAVMKPLSSLTRPLETADLDTHDEAVAITQRSDACAVPRAGVVLEHVVAFVLAAALLEKTGGDTVDEVTRNLNGYLEVVERR